MTKIYNKLIRDKILEMIAREGKTYEVETLNDTDYKQALRNKVVEEAQEVSAASDDDLITEIADLYEVIDALIAIYGLSKSDIIQKQHERREIRGGFDKRLKLISTSD
ncbi:MAG: nucleotide pyrophosphohydrolase [Phototrophicales bacterium]|nr:MAG: nucleotide pyrophosphohydrolase [Phototrophicales bacterium]